MSEFMLVLSCAFFLAAICGQLHILFQIHDLTLELEHLRQRVSGVLASDLDVVKTIQERLHDIQEELDLVAYTVTRLMAHAERKAPE